MLVLGIDTTTSAGSIGLIDQDGIIAEELLNIKATHSERLMPAVKRTLAASGRKPEQIEGIAVAVGPGSFTGTRIGLTAAKTMAQVLDIPVVGISTLEILAFGAWPFGGLICSVIDARHQRGYYALYRSRKDSSVLENIHKEDVAPFTEISSLLERLSEPVVMVGDGVFSYQDFWKEKEGVIIPPAVFHLPRGGSVAGLGLLKLQKGEKDNLLELKPLYLKKPQAEINWEKKYNKTNG